MKNRFGFLSSNAELLVLIIFNENVKKKKKKCHEKQKEKSIGSKTRFGKWPFEQTPFCLFAFKSNKWIDMKWGKLNGFFSVFLLLLQFLLLIVICCTQISLQIQMKGGTYGWLRTTFWGMIFRFILFYVVEQHNLFGHKLLYCHQCLVTIHRISYSSKSTATNTFFESLKIQARIKTLSMPSNIS